MWVIDLSRCAADGYVHGGHCLPRRLRQGNVNVNPSSAQVPRPRRRRRHVSCLSVIAPPLSSPLPPSRGPADGPAPARSTGAPTTSAPARTPTLTSSPSSSRPRPASSSAPAGPSAPTLALATSGPPSRAPRAISFVRARTSRRHEVWIGKAAADTAVGYYRQCGRPADEVERRQAKVYLSPCHLPPPGLGRLPWRPLLVSCAPTPQ